MVELKPCPFCGSEAKFAAKGYTSSNYTVGFSCVIECTKCGCTPFSKNIDITITLLKNGEVEPTDAGKVNIENMIYIWNRRWEERDASEKV